MLGVCERSFRRYLVRYEEEGLAGLIDRRLEQVSNRQAPVYEGDHAELETGHLIRPPGAPPCLGIGRNN